MPESHNHSENSHLGFWIYLMTDLLTFATLFATFAVLRNNTFGGPIGENLFSLPFVLTETIILLFSGFTCGLATLGANQQKIKQALAWFSITFLLGNGFL